MVNVTKPGAQSIIHEGLQFAHELGEIYFDFTSKIQTQGTFVSLARCSLRVCIHRHISTVLLNSSLESIRTYVRTLHVPSPPTTPTVSSTYVRVRTCMYATPRSVASVNARSVYAPCARSMYA